MPALQFSLRLVALPSTESVHATGDGASAVVQTAGPAEGILNGIMRRMVLQVSSNTTSASKADELHSSLHGTNSFNEVHVGMPCGIRLVQEVFACRFAMMSDFNCSSEPQVCKSGRSGRKPLLPTGLAFVTVHDIA